MVKEERKKGEKTEKMDERESRETERKTKITLRESWPKSKSKEHI